jgi:hypothetical protein
MKCPRCKKECEEVIKPGVPWGTRCCKACRERDGYCYKCRANRNDCSC